MLKSFPGNVRSLSTEEIISSYVTHLSEVKYCV